MSSNDDDLPEDDFFGEDPFAGFEERLTAEYANEVLEHSQTDDQAAEEVAQTMERLRARAKSPGALSQEHASPTDVPASTAAGRSADSDVSRGNESVADGNRSEDEPYSAALLEVSWLSDNVAAAEPTPSNPPSAALGKTEPKAPVTRSTPPKTQKPAPQTAPNPPRPEKPRPKKPQRSGPEVATPTPPASRASGTTPEPTAERRLRPSEPVESKHDEPPPPKKAAPTTVAPETAAPDKPTRVTTAHSSTAPAETSKSTTSHSPAAEPQADTPPAPPPSNAKPSKAKSSKAGPSKAKAPKINSSEAGRSKPKTVAPTTDSAKIDAPGSAKGGAAKGATAKAAVAGPDTGESFTFTPQAASAASVGPAEVVTKDSVDIILEDGSTVYQDEFFGGSDARPAADTPESVVDIPGRESTPKSVYVFATFLTVAVIVALWWLSGRSDSNDAVPQDSDVINPVADPAGEPAGDPAASTGAGGAQANSADEPAADPGASLGEEAVLRLDHLLPQIASVVDRCDKNGLLGTIISRAGEPVRLQVEAEFFGPGDESFHKVDVLTGPIKDQNAQVFNALLIGEPIPPRFADVNPARCELRITGVQAP